MSESGVDYQAEDLVIHPEIVHRPHVLLHTLYGCKDPDITRAGAPSPFAVLGGKQSSR